MNICKKTLLFFSALVFSFMLMSLTCSAQEDGIFVDTIINDQPFEQAAIVNDVPYVPFRSFVLFVDPDATFEWDNENKCTVANTMGMSITASAGDCYIVANDRVLYGTDENLILPIEVLYVPAKTMAKAYSLCYSWLGGDAVLKFSGTPEPITAGVDYYFEDDLYWLSRIINAEARGESFDGQIAVGNVVLNRVNDPYYPNSIYGVIFAGNGRQFSPVASGSIYNEPSQSAILAAKVCLEGFSISTDALYFCTNAVAPGSWIASARTFAFTIGNHSFFN